MNQTHAAILPAEPATPAFRYAPLLWMALGTFAVGTEGFMIAAILPRIAGDLAVSLQAAGQLVTIFALTYALSSPVLTAITGGLDRRWLLLLSMAAFAVANFVAAMASGYGSLAVARVLLAMAAGLYVPGANALAAAYAPPERRGRAIAIVNGGLTVAVALGVPLGAFVGVHFGWRMTFVVVAFMATAALAGLIVGMPRGIGAGLTSASLGERLAVLRRPDALAALLVTTLWALGGYTVYTYIAPLLETVAHLQGAHVGYALALWGIAALVGVLGGGMANDRFGGRRVHMVVLPAMGFALFSLSVSAWLLSPAAALVPVLVAIAVWGVAGWAFYPPQQARLMGIVGPRGASVALSLNASFMYLGFSLGAALGSLTLTVGSIADLGWVGSLFLLASLGLFLVTGGRKRRSE